METTDKVAEITSNSLTFLMQALIALEGQGFTADKGPALVCQPDESMYYRIQVRHTNGKAITLNKESRTALLQEMEKYEREGYRQASIVETYSDVIPGERGHRVTLVKVGLEAKEQAGR